MLFDRQDLTRLIIPLIGEQFLAMALGIVDTVMVAPVGEAAISAISLVNIIANLIIQLLGALCTGGAVVVAQYLGRKDLESATKGAEQVMLLSVGLMTVCTALFLLFRQPILRASFGAIGDDVMRHAQTYWVITAFSFPFLAAYNASIAVFRAAGNSRAALNTSIVMNLINLGGNALLIYVLRWGVAGAAVSTLASRMISAVMLLVMFKNRQMPIHIERYLSIRPDRVLLKSIFRIGVPGGVESGLFNFGKLLVQGVVAGLGTAALAANAVLTSIASVLIVPGMAINYAMITVVGQCIGAGEYGQAEYYVKKLMKIALLCMAAVSLPLWPLGRAVMWIFNLSPETAQLALATVPSIALTHAFLWPFSFTLPNALRAAGDVRYTMVIAFISMWTTRVGFSYIFVSVLGFGVEGVWYAMYLDWAVRSVAFLPRYRSGKWKAMKVIS